MALNSVPKNVLPSLAETNLCEFKVCEVKDVIRKVELPDGTSFTETIKQSFTKPVPHEEFENRGLSCDLFSVENQKRAGVDLFSLPVGSALFTSDSPIDLGEQINSIDFDSININSQNVENNENAN